MKKIILSISFLFPLFLFAQETRVLNGRYNDGQTFGKPIPDTVRTLVASSPLSIVSGGPSLVDTIKSGGSSGNTAGSNGYIQFNSSGSFGGSSNLFWDNTNNRLGIGTSSPSYDLDIVHSTNGAIRAAITNSNTGTSAQTLYQAGNGTSSFQVGVTGTSYTTSGLTVANTVFFQSNAGSRLLFKAIGGGSNTAPIIFGVGTDGNTEAMRIFGNGVLGIGQNTDSTAYLVLRSGTTSLASIKINSGVAPSSPGSGQMWYETTNSRLMFNTGSNSIELLGALSVNVVSPTSPNRTIRVFYDGAWYYIAAKTSND